MRDYKNLEIWKRSYAFTVRIYEITRDFPKNEMYGMISQIRRASASMPTNIVEGCSRSTPADFARFLEFSLGSAFEVEQHVMLSKDLRYLTNEDYNLLSKEIDELKKMISSYMLSVRESKK